MSYKVLCPVCLLYFLHRGETVRGEAIICSICGAKLEITQTGPEVKASRFPQPPLQEITGRVNEFASLRGYVFNEDKDLIIEGLMEKFRQYGDFYCPCRYDNIAENVCPCQETINSQVRKEGMCL